MTKLTALERKLLLGTAALAMLASTAPAYAQDNSEELELLEDEVVVTGIRKSIEDSLDLKRDAGSIIEAITAEDIGKLPDVSIADSLARLPGVTAQRVRGRAQQISIRGLGPDFSLALLNGREVVSAGQNRGIEFDQFPSELIAQGVVYKTSDARLAAIGIAGAVDLRTVKPLDYAEPQANLSARYIINDNGSLNPDFDNEGYRLFGSYIGQSDDGTLGYAIGITHQNNPTQFFSRELKTSPGQTFATPGGSLFAADNPRSGVVSRDFERTSIAGTLQFEPNDNVSATIDGFWSDFDDTGIFRGVETPLARWAGVGDGRGEPVPAFPETAGTGDFVDGARYTQGVDSATGIAQVLRTDTEGAEAEIFAVGGNLEFDVNERLGIMLDAAHSSLDRNDIDYESYAGTGSRIFGSYDFGANFYNAPRDASLLSPVSIAFLDNGRYQLNTGIDYGDPANVVLADPGGWGQVGFVQEPEVDDELNQLRAEVEYDLYDTVPLVSSVIGGVLFTDREKEFVGNRAFLRASAAFDDLNGAPIPQGSIEGRTDSGTIGLDIVAYDPASLVEDGTYVVEQANGNFYTIDEEITTLYAQLQLVGGMDDRLTGNLGIRYEDVEQSSTGTLGTLTGAQATQTLTDSYDNWLPTLNLAYQATEDVVLRGAIGRAVTRPRLDALAANQGVGFNLNVCPDDVDNPDGVPNGFNAAAFNPPQQVCLGFGGGNPFLRPYKSTNFDVSAEWYFSPAGAFSVAGFHKDINDYIQDASSVITNRDAVINAGLPAALVDANPDLATFTIGGPANVGEGSLTGFEAALRLPFGDFIDSPWLQGFGFNGSYTYTDATVEFNGNEIDIPGYSSDVASGEIYYERNGWRARVNTAYRSGYRAELIEFNGNLIGDRAKSRTTVDAQLGYEFQQGSLQGLLINLEAYNLTDEPFRTEDNGFIDRREDYGTTYQLTVAKKF